MNVRHHLLWILPAAALSIGAAPAQPTWLEAPTYADVAAAYPAKARAEHVRGEVAFSCTTNLSGRLEACANLRESPSGYGFLAAGHKLIRHFRADAPHDTEVRLVIGFDPGMAGAGPAVAANPTWAAVPSASDFQASFPKTENGVNNVRVVLDCGVVAGGALTGCAVASENPAGAGYGAGALTLAPKFRVGLMTPAGVPTVGAHIQVPIRYELTSEGPKS